MPRRKKNGQSPARGPCGPPEGVSRLLPGFDSPGANNSLSSSSPPGSVKEEIVRRMQEMFSHLDPEVIYIVMSECDFKVENAMDSLLELSVAAEVSAPVPSPVSGFERTAAALLSPGVVPDHIPDAYSSRPPDSASSPPLLTEELDLLVDQELETLTTQQEINTEHQSSQNVSSFPPPSFPQTDLPELLQSSLQLGTRDFSVQQQGPVGGHDEHISGAASPLDQLSTWEKDKSGEEQKIKADFTHLMTETSADKPAPPLDLAASGRPSAFQVYKKQDSASGLLAGTLSPNPAVGGARSKVNMFNQEQLSYIPQTWNLEAPEFSPNFHGNLGPVFVTPVAQTSSGWGSLPRHHSPWMDHAPVRQAPLKPSATIPKSWSQQAAAHPPAQHCRLRLEGKVLVLLRGAPGSGKSTLGRALTANNPGGVKLSTDDYFIRNGRFEFDPSLLAEAHAWNHQRAKEAFERGANPIIIDNTNLQGWEMKPYVAQALKHGYKVLFREPDTWWKYKPRELERRNTHNVPVETIRRMLNGYERFVTVHSIMGSQMPDFKQRDIQENRSLHLGPPEPPCPDLVGQPSLNEGCKNARQHLFSSLPDVSSIGHSSEVGMIDDGTEKSTESLDRQSTEGFSENQEISERDDEMDMGELDSELDAHSELSHPGDQKMPDCIVESVMNEDHRGDEEPVAFSESIRQRVRRERTSRRDEFDRMEPADPGKDTNQSDSEANETARTEIGVEAAIEEEDKREMLDFVGDWPSEDPLQQRQVRTRERNKEGKLEAYENTSEGKSGPNVAEFQRLLDLIQTGVAAIQTGSSGSSSSSSSGEESAKEEDADVRFKESHISRSSDEELEECISRISNSRGELPDCVLDWKAADSCKVRESRLDKWERLKTGNEDESTIGGVRSKTEISIEAEIVDLSPNNPTNTFLLSKSEQADVCRHGEGSCKINEEVRKESGAGQTEVDTTNCLESMTDSGGSHNSEVCLDQVCEGSLEAESCVLSGGSQERKLRQGRRSGKQCKLALTFTQNCLPSLLNSVDGQNATETNKDTSQNCSSADVEPNCNINQSLESYLDLYTGTTLEVAEVDTGCHTQTEPQDFALLWRLNRHNSHDDAGVSLGNHARDVTVLSGDSSRFVPELSSAVSAAVAVHPSGHKEVPYRVVHEKGTQVEDREFGAAQDRLESLRILSRHFKLVSFDTLEDLYDKCHQDLEWTTNLLLDSGERFFKDEDGEKEMEDLMKHQTSSNQCEGLDEAVDANLCANSSDLLAGVDEVTKQVTSDTIKVSDMISINNDVISSTPVKNKNHPDTIPPFEKSDQTEVSLIRAANEGDGSANTKQQVTSQVDPKGGAWGFNFEDDGVIIEQSRVEMEEEIASMDEVQRLLQAELEQMEREERRREVEKSQRSLQEGRRRGHLDIKSVELKLPTEVALQLTELFGPVGVDPGSCSSDDCVVQMDLNLAKLVHQKWKENIQEKQRQATLSFHLLQESSVHWGESQAAKQEPRDSSLPARFLLSTDGYSTPDVQPENQGQVPLMDHWSVSQRPVSFRDIIKEEQALQENMEKTRQNRAEIDRRDGATMLKESQLYALFPTIDRHFLQDIFRDHNYCLTETELFLRSLLDEEPVRTVVAPEAPRSDQHRAASKEREKKQKPLESTIADYQDTEDPEYVDFRAEASLQRKRQLESFAKAAEAYKQGRKEVASFYAQQGHMHGQRMREANHRAAVQIFQRVNASLLPRNILDLHGLHVDEALEHLARVLEDKRSECEQGLCQPQLSIITGKGNHSQGGVARIRPAVIDYLTNRHYRFTEPNTGHVLVSLK